ncbi:Sir2-like protein 1 [Elsinoe fawcettii]|nr:Sir2-like protein 1 [Elsinoe fawcettii]
MLNPRAPGPPPMKRSKSAQDTVKGPTLLVSSHGSPESGAASAPERIEGNDDEDSDDIGSPTSSIVEDAMDAAEDRPYIAAEHEEGCDPDEAKQLRSLLRRIGAQEFIQQTLNDDMYSLRQLVTAFGVRPDLPYPDSWYLRILSESIQRELRRRQKLRQYNTIDDAVFLLKKSKRIMVITGAGISTSLGIPDFRSKNTGFYSQLQERGFTEPEEVFDIHLFDEDPTVFYSLAGEILPVVDRCSPTHTFIKLLQDQDKLLTNYTQNIDNIEQYAGIKPEKLIQCHGSWATAVCRKCGHTVNGLEIFEHVKTQKVPRCEACERMLKVQQPKKRKRGSANSSRTRKSGFSDDDSDGEYDIPQAGVMKPGITFFGEKLPNNFFDRLTDVDKDLVDLVVVIGTSMKVAPVNEIPNFVPPTVPHIYISREPVKHINFDIQLVGYCDDVVSELARRAGWQIDHPKFNKQAKAKVERYDEDTQHQWSVRIPGKAHTKEETTNPGV